MCSLLLWAGACQPTAEVPSATQAERKAQITYTLRLDKTGVELVDEASQAWRLTTNLGYEVQISTMYVSSYSAELLACEQTSLVARLLGFELISSAWAGHSGVAAEASTTKGILEAWHKLDDRVDFDVREVAQVDYCKLHYLIARNDDRFELTDASLPRLTVKVEGTWRSDATQTPQPFSVESAINNGKIFTIAQDPQGAPLPFNASTIEVHITRKLATVFDEIEFSDAAEDDIARGTIKGIIEGTTVELITQ